METKFKLDHMIVSYHESNIKEYPLKIKFMNSLYTYPLSSIENQIYVRYKLNNDRDLHLIIKHGDFAEKWNVFEGDDLFFSFVFTSINERDFIDIFEGQLKQKLEKQECEEHQVKYPYSLPSSEHDAEVTL